MSDNLQKNNICLMKPWVLVNVSDQAKTKISVMVFATGENSFTESFGPSYYSKILYFHPVSHI